MNGSDFCVGILVGIVLAGVLAAILRAIVWSLDAMHGFTQPQVVVHHTADTPWDVLQNSIVGCIGLVVLILVVVAALWLAASLLL